MVLVSRAKATLVLLLVAFSTTLASAENEDIEASFEYCEDLAARTNKHASTGGMRYFDYPSPDTLSLEQLREDLEERKAIVRDYAINEAVFGDGQISLLLEDEQIDNVTSLLLPELECLQYEKDPDFIILYLVRILFMTREFDELIIPFVEEIPLWVTKGEKLRTYWSENHMIMYTSSAYLLRQKFPERFPADNDPTLDSRLSWLLKSKAESGFLEFNSQLYMSFTLSGLLNLYDFAEDSEIKALAHACLTRFLTDWVEVTNSFGVSAVASSRTYQLFFFTAERPSNYSRIYGYANQEAMSLITGMGPLVVEGKIFTSTSFLLQSDFDLAPIAASYTPELYVTKRVGSAYREGIEFLFKNLSREDRFIAQLSMGGYANADYIADFFDFGETYDLWDHDVFSASRTLKYLPTGVVQTLADIISSVGAGSVLNVPDLKIYKNHNIMLSSLNNYFAGQKVYQQFPWAAVIGDEAVFTQSLSKDIWNISEVKGQTVTNDQMPLLIQDHNLLISIYNPNADLSLIGTGNMEVGFHFDDRNFDEVFDGRNMNNIDDKWIFGRVGEGYIAVYRHCINDDHTFKVCFDTQQVWITLIGNNRTHGSFPEFMNEVVDNSELESSIGTRCISVKGILDGKSFDVGFCRRLGTAYVALIIMIFYVVFQICCCFVCCRKKRKVWKNVIVKTKNVMLPSTSVCVTKDVEEDMKNGSRVAV